MNFRLFSRLLQGKNSSHKRKSIILMIALSLLLLIGFRLDANTPEYLFTLKNGNLISGSVIKSELNRLTIQTPYGNLKIPREDVLRQLKVTDIITEYQQKMNEKDVLELLQSPRSGSSKKTSRSTFTIDETEMYQGSGESSDIGKSVETLTEGLSEQDILDLLSIDPGEIKQGQIKISEKTAEIQSSNLTGEVAVNDEVELTNQDLDITGTRQIKQNLSEFEEKVLESGLAPSEIENLLNQYIPEE